MFVSLLLLALFQVAIGEIRRTPPPTASIIVKMRECDKADRVGGLPLTEKLSLLSRLAGHELGFLRCMSGGADVLSLSQKLPQSEVEAIATRIAVDADVEYAEADRVALPDLAPTDPLFVTSQWALKSEAGSAALTSAWDVTTGSPALIIAVLDTGIVAHPDLSGRYIGGYNLISDATIAGNGVGRSSDPTDLGDFTSGCPGVASECSTWHGTHVAGIIAAAANNSIGIAGVNWTSRILPVRVLGRGGGLSSDIIDGIRWAAGLSVTGVPANAYPAKVLNLSLGASGACGTYQSAINDVTAIGVTVVVSAGNDGKDLAVVPKTPAVCDGVVTVTSVKRNGLRPGYANTGSVVDIAAPGGDTSVSDVNGIYSTVESGATTASGSYTYSSYQGTSMAAPHVAGVVSLLLSISSDLTSSQVLTFLRDSATAFVTGSDPDVLCTTSTSDSPSKSKCGAGMLSAPNAISQIRSRVSVAAFGGDFLLSRSGNTLSRIAVRYTLSGPATAGIEAGKLSGTVVFASGSAQAIASLSSLSQEITAGNVSLSLETDVTYQLEAPLTATVSATPSAAAPGAELLRGAAPEARLSECGLVAAFRGTSASIDWDRVRHFRDAVLAHSALGRQVIRVYYRLSPVVSRLVARHSMIRALVQWSATPWIYWVGGFG